MMGKRNKVQPSMFYYNINIEKKIPINHPLRGERSFADGANLHGLKRARWRGQWRMAIQGYMISAIQNIRILIHHTYLRANSGVMINKELLNKEIKSGIMANFILGLYIFKIWSGLNENMIKIERKN